MRIGEYNYKPLTSPLNSPHCIAVVHPWLDIGNVGRLVLGGMAKTTESVELAALAEPGKFYDFTRFRPQAKIANGKTLVRVPNTIALALRTSQNGWEHDLVLLNMLEPHLNAERYIGSTLELLRELHVTRYVLIGGVYAQTPHTRTLPLKAVARNWHNTLNLKSATVVEPAYNGKTTILSLMHEQLANSKLPYLSLMVELPSYLKIQDNHIGAERLAQAVDELYNTSVAKHELPGAQDLLKRVGKAFETNSNAAKMLSALEKRYDGGTGTQAQAKSPPLAPEFESFLSNLLSKNQDNPNG